MKQLLRSATATAVEVLSHHQEIVARDNPTSPTELIPNLSLLRRFQRLLFQHLLPAKKSENEDKVQAAAVSLLKKYAQMLGQHLAEVMSLAASIPSSSSPGRFCACACALESDVIGVLLPEFVLNLTLILCESPGLLANIELGSVLTPWLSLLDSFNRLAPGLHKEDADDLAWTGTVSRRDSAKFRSGFGNTSLDQCAEGLAVIRQADLENHNRDGGHWVIVRGKVYDVMEDVAVAPVIAPVAAFDDDDEDATDGDDKEGEEKDGINERMQLVGIYEDANSDTDRCEIADAANFSSPFMDLERNLALLLGLYCHSLVSSDKGHSPSPAEDTALFLRAGLRAPLRRDPFDETKGESAAASAPVPSSTTPLSVNTPTTESVEADEDCGDCTTHQEDTKGLNSSATDNKTVDGNAIVFSLAEGKLDNPSVQVLLDLMAKLGVGANAGGGNSGVGQNHHQLMLQQMNFPAEHPVEETGRILLTVLLRFLGLENLTAKLVSAAADMGDRPQLPRPIADVFRAVHAAKWRLIRTRQEQGKSYKEVCSAANEKCRFLLAEIRPYHESKREVKVLHEEAKLKVASKRVIDQLRNSPDRATTDQSSNLVQLKPEDLLNVSIQSQDALQNLIEGRVGSRREVNSAEEDDVALDHVPQGDQEIDTYSREREENPEDIATATSLAQFEENSNDVLPEVALNEKTEVRQGASSDESDEVDDEAKDEDSKRLDPDDVGRASREVVETDTDKAEGTFQEHEKTTITDSMFAIENLGDDEVEEEEEPPATVIAAIKKDDAVSSLDQDDNQVACPLTTSEASKVTLSILDFVLRDDGNRGVAELRTILLQQTERACVRFRGFKTMAELLKKLRDSELIPSVKYALLNGWLGAAPLYEEVGTRPHCLEGVELIPRSERAQILLAHSEVLEWIVEELRLLTHRAEATVLRQKFPAASIQRRAGARFDKESLNHRDLHGVGSMPSTRFLLSVLGAVAASIPANGQVSTEPCFIHFSTCKGAFRPHRAFLLRNSLCS